MADIEKVNSQLARALSERQKSHYWISSIGDILLEYVCEFDPFVAYGAHQIIGKFYFELEKKRNPLFAEFVEVMNKKKREAKKKGTRSMLILVYKCKTKLCTVNN